MNSKDLTLFNAHTGSHIRTNRYYFVSLDELKKFCSNQFNIPISQIFLISPFGIKLNNSSFDEIDEIYVFDRNLFTHDNNDAGIYLRGYLQAEKLENIDNLIQPIISPLLDSDLDAITKRRNSRQLISLLTTNLGWVSAIESDSSLFTKKSVDLEKKIKVLFKSLKVAIQYIEGYSIETKKNFDSSVEFTIDLQKYSLNLTWKDHFKKLGTLKQVDGKSLSSLLNQRDLKSQSDKSIKLNEDINSDFVVLRSKIEESNKQRKNVESELQVVEKEYLQFLNSFSPEESLSELHTLCSKVQKDTRTLLEKTTNSIDDFDIEIILETFHKHKDDFVTKIYDISYKLHQHLLAEKELFSKLQIRMAKFLENLSYSQTEVVSLRESLKLISSKVEEIQTIESTLAYTIDLPLLYGLYLIESLRRSQWLQDMNLNASKTNENFATLRAKEVKIRSQWLKNYGVILTLLDYNISSFNSNNLISFEIISNEDKSILPEQVFVYEDCLEYIQSLKAASISSEISNVLVKTLEELPTKRPNLERKPISSKSDSEAIKGYKTRIRKLENLLHQEQFKSFSQNWNSSISRTSSVSRASPAIDGSNHTTLETGLHSRSASPPQKSEELIKVVNENRQLSESLKSSNESIERLNDEIKASRQLLSMKEFETQNLAKRVEELEEENKTKMSKLQRLLTEGKVEIVKLDSQAKADKDTISELEKKLLEKDELIESLKKEHSEKQKDLVSQIENSKETAYSKELEDELSNIKDRMKKLEEESSQKSEVIEEKIALLKKQELLIENEENSVKEKDLLIGELSSKIEASEIKSEESINQLHLQLKGLTISNEKLETDLKVCKEDFARLKSMKNDLLENMSNRENEFAKEKGAHQDEVESLKLKLEELEKLEQDQEDLQIKSTENNKKHVQTIAQLVIIIDKLLFKCKDLSDILYHIYQLIDESLRNIGLLAVESQEQNKVDIIRVKGLRKSTTEMMSSVDLSNGFRPVSESNVEASFIWSQIPDSQLIIKLNTDVNIDLETLEITCESLIKAYNSPLFEDSYSTFIKHLTNLNILLVPSVSKRFREVEHLAKKELKENKKLKDNEKNKISIRNFEVGDLVLFLPTRNISDPNQPLNNNQWAAFNDMGDVKYLLKNQLDLQPQRQWFIGRILNIENVSPKDFLITAEEIVLS